MTEGESSGSPAEGRLERLAPCARADAEDAAGIAALRRRERHIREHYDRVAPDRSAYIESKAYYFREVARVLQTIIPEGLRVLLVGSLTPDFLAAVKPRYGLGIDRSPRLVEFAAARFPQLHFQVHDNYRVPVTEPFDYVVITDINEQSDPIAALRSLRDVMTDDTRIVIYNYNHLWEPVVRLAEWLGSKFPLPLQNWLSQTSIADLLYLTDFEALQTYRSMFLPKAVPLLSFIANSILARLPGFHRLCMIEITVARPVPTLNSAITHSVSVIVPCRNEVGNVAAAIQRIPLMGSHTEIIFCDDKSTDGTAAEVQRLQRLHGDKDIKLYDGPGICKALNVWTGFDRAEGDILMILDADLTTMPEELPYFFDALVKRKGEFINGTRMIYPMQRNAMRPVNILGNFGFSRLFSFILNQRVTDTLCGTKVLWRKDWPKIRSSVGQWGIADRWGDYDLLFGAAKYHLRIVDLPVHYQDRVSGETKMTNRLRNGLRMLRLCWAGFVRFKLY
jgi:hypothetical protein